MEIHSDFIQKYLPHLLPFDGINCHSVVVLDNCSIHHIPEVAAMIEEVGAIVHYLPPYSPNFNPIEEAFSKVKLLWVDISLQHLQTMKHSIS